MRNAFVEGRVSHLNPAFVYDTLGRYTHTQQNDVRRIESQIELKTWEEFDSGQ